VKAKYIIGVHDGHNAAAAILRDGALEFAIQEERLAGTKNYYGFPSRSIQACLDFCGIGPGDVDELAFVTMRRTPSRFQVKSQRKAAEREVTVPGSLRRMFLWYPVYRAAGNMGWKERLDSALDMGFDASACTRYHHHIGHAATAYFGMRQDHDQPYLVITLDGKGDMEAGTVSIARRGELRRIASTPLTDSLGTIYALTTAAMGFVPLEHEYKLMGMAPYASPEHAAEAREAFSALIEVERDTLRLRRRTPEPTFLYQRRLRRLINGMRFDNVCAGLQAMCEDVVVELVRAAVARTGIRRVLCAGGVFMNVKANKRLRELPEIEYLGVPPSCGDESMCFGIAWYAYARRAGAQAAAGIAPLNGHIYLGTDVDERIAAQVVERSGHAYQRPDDIELEVARLLAAGHPVARCKGRMEFGARALGNRSILADPKNPDVVRVINRMIKKRDFWMPFAPVVRSERLRDYFDAPEGFESPYMMHTFDTRGAADAQEFMGAVHNADLTARTQTVREESNPDYYRILSHFEELTGRGVLLNTSFNLHGYPVVHGPQEAMHVFQSSGLEYLAVGPYLVKK
jgi:carbamoyltransferase